MKTTLEIEMNILKRKRNKIKNSSSIDWDKMLYEIKDFATTFYSDENLIHSFQNCKIYNVRVKILNAVDTIKNMDLYATVQVIEILEHNKNHILAHSVVEA